MVGSVVTLKGQVVIPVQLRRKLGIKKGTRVRFFEENGELRLVPLTEAFIDAHIGILKGKRSLLRALAEEKKREREL